jgi:hypothetical protein
MAIIIWGLWRIIEPVCRPVCRRAGRQGLLGLLKIMEDYGGLWRIMEDYGGCCRLPVGPGLVSGFNSVFNSYNSVVKKFRV